MSTKRKRRTRKPISSQRKPHRRIVLAIASVVLVLGFTIVVASLSRSSEPGKPLSWFTSPPPPPPISKEYVYAGKKLVATEEPGMLVAPANVLADTFSATRVDITWNASAGADHYQVERAGSITGSFTVLNSNVTTTSYSDTTVSSVNTYIYRVRAANSSGDVSQYGNIDAATAITFTDNPLIVNSTLIKAAHVTELRQAVDAMRVSGNLAAATWTDTNLSGVPIKAIHLEELRTNLDQALTALGLSTSAYTNSSLSGVDIKKTHVDELRQRVE